eukprot:IDg16679t1
MALEGHAAAVPVARLVLERSAHAQLAGTGASVFAAAHGIPPVCDSASLLSAHAASRYAEWQRSTHPVETGSASGHTDTVGVLALDEVGRLAVGVATSGMQFKTHGRVGDSPVVGAGLYALDGAGAAAASGDGDRMVRHCIAVRVVDLMADGTSASEACWRVMSRVAESDSICQAAVVALGKDGEAAAASTHQGFFVVQWKDDGGGSRVVHARSVSQHMTVVHAVATASPCTSSVRTSARSPQLDTAATQSAICRAVFVLERFVGAVHLLRGSIQAADISIMSRVSIIPTTDIGSAPCIQSAPPAAAMSALSASGSSVAPRTVRHCHVRAICPSSASVSPHINNAPSASAF